MEEHDTYFVMGYNMKVIRTFWKSIKRNCGQNWIRGNENDTSSFYASIEKSRESIRKIECREWNVNKSIIDKWARKIDKKTGISFEYLAGRERIKLGAEFEKKFYKGYCDYVDACDELHEMIEKREEEEKDKEKDIETDIEIDIRKVGYSLAKIKKIAYSNKYTPAEKEEFKGEIDIVEKAAKKIKMFDDALSKEVNRIKKLDMGHLMEKDRKLYRLVYFIKNGKQSEAAGLITMEDILRMMECTGMKELNKYGKVELERYIKVLDRHLTLAKAVYINAMDEKKF